VFGGHTPCLWSAPAFVINSLQSWKKCVLRFKQTNITRNAKPFEHERCEHFGSVSFHFSPSFFYTRLKHATNTVLSAPTLEITKLTSPMHCLAICHLQTLHFILHSTGQRLTLLDRVVNTRYVAARVIFRRQKLNHGLSQTLQGSHQTQHWPQTSHGDEPNSSPATSASFLL
jgi:hypothetical protein